MLLLITHFPAKNNTSLSYYDFLEIDNVEGRFFEEMQIYWLFVKEYGLVLVNTVSTTELLEMYSCLISERICIVNREMYLASKPEENYISYLDKIKKIKTVVISDFEKSEIEEVFKEVR